MRKWLLVLLGVSPKPGVSMDERDFLMDWEDAIVEDDAWESIYHGMY